MPRLLLIALSEQEGTHELAKRVVEIDPAAIVIITAELPFEAAETMIGLIGDLTEKPDKVAGG